MIKSYGQNPNDDSTCAQYFKKAKIECEFGLLKFCTTATWDYPRSRMFEELDSICKTKNLIFTPYPYTEHDYGFDPYSCYVHYMDSVVKMKFDEKFIGNMENYADSNAKPLVVHQIPPAHSFREKGEKFFSFLALHL